MLWCLLTKPSFRLTLKLDLRMTPGLAIAQMDWPQPASPGLPLPLYPPPPPCSCLMSLLSVASRNKGPPGVRTPANTCPCQEHFPCKLCSLFQSFLQDELISVRPLYLELSRLHVAQWPRVEMCVVFVPSIKYLYMKK